MIAAVCEGVANGAQDAGIAAGVVVCALRHHDEDANLAVARLRRAEPGAGVVGFDVAGDELLFPDLGPYVRAVPVRCRCRAGAHRARRGGRPGRATSATRTRRSAFGGSAMVRASGRTPSCSAWSVDHGMCLEVCATSNVFTGAARSIAEHPIHRFLEAGCNVVLGDDNPITIDTRLSREVRAR